MPRKKTDEPTTAVSKVLAEINKSHGLNVGPLAKVATKTEWLTTGNLGIDWVAGKGLPRGRSVELYGPPSSGKTTTGLQSAAALQADIIASGREEYILYLDYEHALDPDYCAGLGLDVNHETFLVAQPHSMEQGVESALKILDQLPVALSIWDSVAAMAPLSRLEGEFDQRTAAMNKARLMSGLMLMLTPLLHKTNSTAVFINHLMESVSMNARPGMPPQKTTPGGKALKFYASLRLEYTRMGDAKINAVNELSGATGRRSVGHHVKVTCVKNKVAAPNRDAEVRLTHGHGFDNTWSALQVLLTTKAVNKTGAWFYFDIAPGLDHPAMPTTGAASRPSINGENAVLAFARKHPDWNRALITAAQEQVAARLAPPTESGDGDDPLADVDLDDLLDEEVPA